MNTETGLGKISETLFMFRDTCNVYALKKDNNLLLIDFGSGSILNHLGSIGVENVEWVLHTHHHRDQCQGDHRLPKDTKIVVPFHERPLFEAAENFWRNKQIYDSYNDQSTYFTLTKSVNVDASLKDYETFAWRGYELHILPAMGHTHGSIALISQIDGNKVAFTGDMIYSAGKVWNLYDLQHSYGGVEGIDLNIFSLRDLKRQEPNIVLPSHGDPITDPEASISETIDNLRKYHMYLTGQPPTIDLSLKKLSPHLLVSSHSCCTFYVLLSDTGKAMLIDYGAASGNHFYAHVRQFESWEVQRFVEHSIYELKKDWGVKSIEVVIPTHYHDDHTCGIPHLQKRYGVELWALDQMTNILENPHEYNVPCLLPYPMKVDRRIADGETVKWEEYELKVVHFPGQTEYHMAMAVNVDGKRVTFTGDSVSGDSSSLSQPIIYRNIITLDSHEKCARELIGLEPDILAGGHGMWLPVDRTTVRTLKERADSTKKMFEALVPAPATVGVNPGWIRFVPYQTTARSGESLNLALEICNYHDKKSNVEVRLILPKGWKSSPTVGSGQVGPGDVSRINFDVKVGDGRPDRIAIAADVTINSKHIGQITEAIVNVGL